MCIFGKSSTTNRKKDQPVQRDEWKKSTNRFRQKKRRYNQTFAKGNVLYSHVHDIFFSLFLYCFPHTCVALFFALPALHLSPALCVPKWAKHARRKKIDALCMLTSASKTMFQKYFESYIWQQQERWQKRKKRLNSFFSCAKALWVSFNLFVEWHRMGAKWKAKEDGSTEKLIVWAMNVCVCVRVGVFCMCESVRNAFNLKTIWYASYVSNWA